MKKIILTIALSLVTFASVSAKGNDSTKVYLPQKGDFAIGVNLNPIINYVGNVFNGTTNNKLENFGGEPSFNGIDDYQKGITPDISFMGKYMITNTFGLRANIGFMVENKQTNVYVQDDKAVALNPFDESKLIDSKNYTRSGMSMMFGTEFRKGSKRVQGVFGAGILFGWVTDKLTYDYANIMTEVNQTPTTGISTYNNNYRTLAEKNANSCFIGATGSAGVEWFVAPKVALGAEVNLNLYYIAGGQQYKETEGYNQSTQKVETRCDLVSPGNNIFRFGTESLGGSVYMSFYF